MVAGDFEPLNEPSCSRLGSCFLLRSHFLRFKLSFFQGYEKSDGSKAIFIENNVKKGDQGRIRAHNTLL